MHKRWSCDELCEWEAIEVANAADEEALIADRRAEREEAELAKTLDRETQDLDHGQP